MALNALVIMIFRSIWKEQNPECFKAHETQSPRCGGWCLVLQEMSIPRLWQITFGCDCSS